MKRYLIEDLIQAPKKVPLNRGNKTIELWVAPVEEAERGMAQSFARKASRKLRKALSDKKSEQFAALVQEEYESASPDALRTIWANGRLIERAVLIRAASLEDRAYIPEPEGEGITPKQMDEYEDAVDDAEEGRETQLQKALEAAAKELDEESKKIPDKKLYDAAIPSIVEVQCQRAYETEFVSQLIYRGTFQDEACTEKAFRDVEQVYKLGASSPAAYTKLTNEHISLMLDPESIKN